MQKMRVILRKIQYMTTPPAQKNHMWNSHEDIFSLWQLNSVKRLKSVILVRAAEARRFPSFTNQNCVAPEVFNPSQGILPPKTLHEIHQTIRTFQKSALVLCVHSYQIYSGTWYVDQQSLWGHHSPFYSYTYYDLVWFSSSFCLPGTHTILPVVFASPQ